MDKYINSFCEYLKNVKNRSENTISSYRLDLMQFSNIVKADDITSITLDMVNSVYIKALVGDNMVASTRSRKLSALKMFFKYLYQQNVIEQNIMEQIELPKIPQKEVKVMSNNEISDIFVIARNASKSENDTTYFRNLAILSLMLNSGIRRNELVNIKITDVDFENSSIIIHGKGDKDRVIYFNMTAKAILSEYLYGHRKLIKTHDTSEYLFITQKSGKLDLSSVNIIINNFLNQSGLKEKGYTVHSLRKAFATEAYRQTNDIVAVQNILGHSNPQTTMRYVGANEKNKKAVSASVNFR